MMLEAANGLAAAQELHTELLNGHFSVCTESRPLDDCLLRSVRRRRPVTSRLILLLEPESASTEPAGHGASPVVSLSLYPGWGWGRCCSSSSSILGVTIGFVKLDDDNPHLALCHQRENARGSHLALQASP